MATNEAPTRESVDKALNFLCDHVSLKNADKAISAEETIRAYIASLEANNKMLAEAAEVGVAYVIAAQNGLTFTQLRMKADMDVFEKALAQTEKEGE